MAYIIVPFLIFASVFILGLFLYWNLKVRAYFKFKKVKKMKIQLTYMFKDQEKQLKLLSYFQSIKIVKMILLDTDFSIFNILKT